MQLEADIFERIKLTMANCQRVDVSEVTPTSTFEAINFDSLDAVELIILLEEEFSVVIDFELARTAKSVSDIVQHIKGLLQ